MIRVDQAMLYTLNLYRAVHNSISIKLQEKSKQHGHQFNKDIFKDGKNQVFLAGARGLSCSTTGGIFLGRGLNLSLLH